MGSNAFLDAIKEARDEALKVRDIILILQPPSGGFHIMPLKYFFFVPEVHIVWMEPPGANDRERYWWTDDYRERKRRRGEQV